MSMGINFQDTEGFARVPTAPDLAAERILHQIKIIRFWLVTAVLVFIFAVALFLTLFVNIANEVHTVQQSACANAGSTILPGC